MTFLDRVRRHSRAAFLGAAAVCLLAIVSLALEIVRDLRLLKSADSDNVQWTLSQAEVEFLEMQHALDRARIERASGAALEQLVVEFDIFYSRIATLSEGNLYGPLRGTPDFGAPLERIQAALTKSVDLIDAPREELASKLDQLQSEFDFVRPDVRALSTAGLLIFARQSDAQRTNVAFTLTRVAILTALLILALAYLLRHARVASRQTERRGKELAAAYSRLNTILETSLDAVIVSGMDGRIQQFNRSAERIFQYDEQEVVGRDIGEVIVPDHLRAAHTAGMKRLKETGSRRVVGHGRVRLEAMRRSGEVFPVELALESAHTGAEEIVIGFLRDISHRVASENELVDARDRALAGEKAKADFLAMMTHEIRTPLNGVLGNLALLDEEKLTPQQTRYVHNMSISGKLLMSHVDAVLDVARFESGASVSEIETVHLGRMLQDIIDSQSSAASANGNVLEWGWSGAPLKWVELDQSRLQQSILNLLGNAIKFTRQGKVSIEVEQVDGPERADDAARWLEIRIIDTGVGISEADLERVFEDFHTGQSPLSHSVAGTGLGLGIARRFVDAMGGDIGAESTLGEGSVFWLRVPVLPVEAPAELAPTPEKSHQVRTCDVLLVEDNEINLQLACDMLEKLGHQVTTARNGQEGVDAAAQRRFDFILMDIRMPVMDGLTATKKIREGQGPCRDVPIIAFSANVLPEAKDRFIAGGMTDFLGKPLMKAELAQLIVKIDPAAAPEERPQPVSETSTGAAAAPEQAPQPEPEPDDPMARLMARYKDETKELFDWLATGPNDWIAIADRAHQIAGSAAAFGQPDLRMALLMVEKAAEEEDTEALSEAVVNARKAWTDAPEPALA
ncbi:ATP-binding protein [Antarctobacter jejuensis]|uniref:ATP-binding protein n=1 Tax=Antarctobacter jejuensis TaxID=1439938 RepID=UPI003FD6554E